MRQPNDDHLSLRGPRRVARGLRQLEHGGFADREDLELAPGLLARGRSYAQLSAYAEAGIARYRIVVVLDEVTTPTCRFLDGKTFAVSEGLDLFDLVEAAPDQLAELTPWIHEQRDLDTGGDRSMSRAATRRISVAAIERSGVGTRDDHGEFSGALRERELAGLEIGFPPTTTCVAARRSEYTDSRPNINCSSRHHR